MLKPRDIAKTEFKRVWRGYSEKEVDEFVRKLVGEYEALYRHCQDLEARLKEMQDRLDRYAQNEGRIDETLALARQTAADLKAAAEQKAELIVAEARAEASRILREAREKLAGHGARIQQLVRQEEAFRSRFRGLLESYWSLLEEERVEADQLARFARALTEAAAGSERDAGDPGDGPSPGRPAAAGWPGWRDEGGPGEGKPEGQRGPGPALESEKLQDAPAENDAGMEATRRLRALDQEQEEV
ncbi:MAG: DivIVA domain-containing protein [Firmicutes bacterium]|nr:DivIVA domain-containing protein [Bacillota bacterium]